MNKAKNLLCVSYTAWGQREELHNLGEVKGVCCPGPLVKLSPSDGRSCQLQTKSTASARECSTGLGKAQMQMPDFWLDIRVCGKCSSCVFPASFKPQWSSAVYTEVWCAQACRGCLQFYTADRTLSFILQSVKSAILNRKTSAPAKSCRKCEYVVRLKDLEYLF